MVAYNHISRSCVARMCTIKFVAKKIFSIFITLRTRSLYLCFLSISVSLSLLHSYSMLISFCCHLSRTLFLRISQVLWDRVRGSTVWIHAIGFDCDRERKRVCDWMNEYDSFNKCFEIRGLLFYQIAIYSNPQLISYATLPPKRACK